MPLTKQRAKILITVLVLAVATFFLFFRLGGYPLWDDEATTAMFARSVWRTGDTVAIQGQNVIAYNDGIELRDLRNRYMPPLQFYLSAPFVGLSSQESPTLAARLPFAICGLLTVVVLLIWLWKSEAPLFTWWLMGAGILGNVSLMLYARQCRYFAPSIFISTLLAFLYFFCGRRRRTLLVMAFVSLFLLASNYMFYAAAYAVMFVDYIFWGRRRHPFQLSDWLILFIPQVILGGILVSNYNLSFLKAAMSHEAGSWFAGRGQLLFWNLRELNSCEHGVGILIVIAPVLYFLGKRNKLLLRGPTGILIYLVAITLLSPKPMEGYGMATVRYLGPIIPLCIFTAVVSIESLTKKAGWLAAVLAVLAFGTNVLHGGPFVGTDKMSSPSKAISVGRLRSTVYDFTRELMVPVPSAYGTVARWVRENVREGQSVWVMPNFATYPLMYHAPKPTYAWQLREKTPQFRDFPDIQFYGKALPDFIIAFGHYIYEVEDVLNGLRHKNVVYDRVEHFNVYWYDLIRPELFFHAFYEVKDFSPESQAVTVFKRVRDE